MLLSIMSTGSAYSQDTLSTGQNERVHLPQKAISYSAILPGLGQAYNNKYWKIPIIYGAGGALIYYINYNHQKYKKFRDAYMNNSGQEQVLIDGRYYSYTILPRGRDYYRKYRDYCVLGFAAIYALNIIDALVDAHFFYYDVSDDLSMQIKPALIHDPASVNAMGIAFHIGF